MTPGRRTVILGLGAAAMLPLVGAGALAQATYDDPDDLYAAFGKQPRQTLRIGGGTIDIVFADSAPGLVREPVLGWIRRSAEALTVYFGHYPVTQYRLLVIAEDGDHVGHATTYGYDGPVTRIHVGTTAGRGAGAAAFARDWVLVHEMVHTALPDLPRRALWLQEGNATYIEPVARAQAGHLPPAEVWRQAVAGMPTGQPDPGDGGMDGTERHGRLYWGGATFWLLAEIGILMATRGKRTLRDAMRGMNRASGGNAVTWTPEHLMAVGDIATGTDVLATLYRHFADTPVTTDLPAVFARLGVVAQNDGSVRFDDRAELADLRRRITAP